MEEFHPADALNRAVERNAITFEKLVCRETNRISARLDPANVLIARNNREKKKENVLPQRLLLLFVIANCYIYSGQLN